MGPAIINHDALDDAEANAALAVLPRLPDNVLILLRNLQAQITDLAGRVADLEA